MPALKDSQVFKVHGDSRWYGRLRQVTTVDVRDFVLTYLSVLYSHALEAPWITADSATRQEDIRTPSVKKDWFLNIIGFASNAGKYELSLSLSSSYYYDTAPTNFYHASSYGTQGQRTEVVF